MKVILVKSVRNLGTAGDIVEVANGFGNNYLIPTKKATYASKEAIAEAEQRMQEILKSDAEFKEQAIELKEKMQDFEVIIERSADSKSERLYGSLGAVEIVSACKKLGLDAIKPEDIRTQGIKSLGEYKISVFPHPDVEVQVKLRVVRPT